MRAAIYCRISMDRLGKKAGVARQEEDCRKICEDRGWEVSGVYVDNDVSAYKGKRPEYLRLVGDVAAGKVDAVVAWASDRLWRAVAEQQAFLGVGQESGLRLIVAGSQEISPGDADSDFMSTLLAAMGQRESQKLGQRQRRRHQQLAQVGGFHGGPRMIGWDESRSRIIKPEAARIRDAAKRILAGESVSSLVTEWNREGFKTARGNRWRVDGMRDLLSRPALAGLRTYKGEVIGDATWPPIIDRQTHDRLRAFFDARIRGPLPRTARKNLLAGFLRCGKCGVAIGGNSQPDGKPYRYRCPAKNSGGCGGITIGARTLEDHVRDLILDRLDSDDFAKDVQRAQQAAKSDNLQTGAILDQLAADRARLVEVEVDYADSVIDAGAYQRLTMRIRTRIAEAESRLAGVVPLVPSVAISARKLRRAWESMSLGERRDVLGALIVTITIEPAVPPVNRWQPERVVITWRI